MPIIPVADLLSTGGVSGYRKVLVVTALPLEMRAVRAHLQHLASCVGKQRTVYECGHFASGGQDWLVVVVQSGAGNHNAQFTVTASAADFNGFELILFMGVAGSRKKDVPIGSVVAASYLYSPYSGKYDGGSFASRPHPIPADDNLKMLAEKVERDREWQARIIAPLHGTIPSDEQYPKPRPPEAFVGPIVSTEAVSADPESELEALIDLHYSDAQAVEMEGYGIAFAARHENTPALIVRGISDARSGKDPELDKIYQPVAGMHAAAFGFEVLALWSDFFRLNAVAPVIQAIASVPAIAATAPPQALLSGQAKIVLNFSGSVAEFPAERVQQIEQILRRETGDETIRAIGSEEGSFRLLVEARPESLTKISSLSVEKALSEQVGASLVGVLLESVYREIPGDIEELRRASLSLVDWPRTLPDGHEIERPELQDLTNTLSSDGRTTVVLGAPGAGKSSLLAAFASKLVLEGIAVLAIKADTLDPLIKNEVDLKDHLGLPDLPSAMITKVASLSTVVLLIDQLDALAGYVDVNTGRLSTLLNLVRKLGTISNVHVILSARTFEFEHDVRLKAVRAESLSLELPPWSTVLGILEEHGIKAAGWPVDAQVVMRSPQALATFLKLADRSDAQPFLTYQAMLDQLWQQLVLEALNGQRLSELLSSIAEWMAANETLWVARVRFDDRHRDIQALLASGILIESFSPGGSIAFSHQTLFEHALARAFAREEISLSKYILSRQASIFIRPKLWAALTYLRAVEIRSYTQEMSIILGDGQLRRHLRRLCIEFMGQQNEPAPAEIALMEAELAAGNKELVFQSIAGSLGWFSTLLHTYIEPAMSVEPEQVGYVGAVLIRAWDFASDDVIAAIKNRWLSNQKYDVSIWHTLQACEVWNDSILGIAQTVLGRTAIADWSLNHLVSILGVEQPRYASALVGASLEYGLKQAVNESEKRSREAEIQNDENEIARRYFETPAEPFKKLLEGNSGWHSLDEFGKAHPIEYLDAVWPWFLRVLKRLNELGDHDPESLGFPIPYDSDFRFENETTLGLPSGPILTSLQAAVETLAENNSEAFLGWAAVNGMEPFNPVQRLIAHGMTVAPDKYAGPALAFFKENPNRFHLGSIEDYSGTSKRLLVKVAPYWDDAQIAEFEALLSGYKPKPRSSLDVKGRRSFRNAVRITKLGLLKALPHSRLSASAKSKVAEEGRRFPGEKLGVTFGEGGVVGSPVDAQNMEKATDDEIINAFRTVPDAAGWNHPKQFFQGGNVQLSREFAIFAKTFVERAASIIRRFEPIFGTRGSAYALETMAESGSGDLIFDLVFELCAKGFDGNEYRISVARAVERLAKRNITIPENVRELLEAWLQTRPPKDLGSDDDDNEDDADRAGLAASVDENENAKDESDAGQSVLWGMGGISVLPHGNYPILETLGYIYLVEGSHERFLSLLKAHLPRSENWSTWRALLNHIGYLHPEDTAGFAAFLSGLIEKYPALVETREMAGFIGRIHWVAPDFVSIILSKWHVSPRRWVRQGFGEMATALAFLRKDLPWTAALLTDILSGDEPDFKAGAAYAAINLWQKSSDRTVVSSVLQELIPGASDRTWDAIFDIFRVTGEITPSPEWIDFLKVLATEIRAGRKCTSNWIIEKLSGLLPDEAILVADIAARLVVSWKDELGDIRTGTAATSPEFVDLALTLHRLGPETRDHGTALFEDLLEVNAYSARQTLDEIDNRFLAAARAPRARLRPRTTGRRRRDTT